jgi:N-acetylglucosamine-6-phosphate deacetylase
VIDLQVNGAGGHDLTSEPEAVWKVGAALTRFGVTAFLPTLVSPAWAVVDRAREALQAGPPPGYAGATPLGWHVEGPFLAPTKAGAHDPASLRSPSVEAVAGWSPDSGIRMVTLAPELPGALEVVRALVANGVVVSAGHSAATSDQAAAGFEAGIRGVTHLFNAMAPLDHREPGLVGAALADDRVTVWLIPDGLHVHPTVVGLVRRTVGPERFAIVSDAISALGVGPGRHHLAGRDIEVDATSARLPDGVLAGSVIGLDEGVRNLAAFAGCSLDEARLAATRVPARLLGLSDDASLPA